MRYKTYLKRIFKKEVDCHLC